MDITKELIKLRYKEGLSQREAAEKAGLRTETVACWEVERYSPSVKKLNTYLKIYGKELAINETT